VGGWNHTHVVYTFDGANGRLESLQDRNGNTQTLSYTGGGLSRVADGMGATLDFRYSSAGNLTRLTDQSGRSVAFTYSRGVQAAATDVGAQTTTFTYSGGALLASARLPRGNVPFTNLYDSSGRVDPLGQASSYTHNNRNLTREVDPAGRVTTLNYDTRSRPISRTDAAGNGQPLRAALEHDLQQPWAAPDTAPATLRLDSLKRLVSKQRSDGTSISYTYDAYGSRPHGDE
jgi:YD repeat-containing protein